MTAAVPPSLTAALDAVPYGFAMVDGDGVLHAANRPFLEMFGGSTEAALVAALLGANVAAPLKRAVNAVCPEGSYATELDLAGGPARIEVARTGDGGWVVTVESLAERRRAEAQAKRAQKVALVALADLAEYRDGDAGEHVLRVARMTHEIARALKAKGQYPRDADEAFLQHIGMASILHDVGKVGVPDSVLLKPGSLTDDERRLMEHHASSGGAILRKAERMLAGGQHFRLAGEVSDSHHECWDGSGYPRGLKGEEIPLSARIVAIADVYDALTSKRPFKEPWPEALAISFITERRGGKFDPLAVDSFLDVLEMRRRAARFGWSDDLAIGHGAIDRDHRAMLALINQLASPENRDDAAALEFVLDELVISITTHFHREEELMAEAHYPGLEHHRQVHRMLAAEMTTLQRSFGEGGGDLSAGSDLARFLTTWLTAHIMDEDRLYRPHVVKG